MGQICPKGSCLSKLCVCQSACYFNGASKGLVQSLREAMQGVGKCLCS